jgi:hypothetical protein
MRHALNMTRITSSLVIILAGTLPAQAQGEPAADSAFAEARFVHNTEQGPNQGLVRRWDGKTYDIVEFDLGLRTGWREALLDLDLSGLRSTNEQGSLDFSLGSFLTLKGEIDRLTHREPFMRNGVVTNGRWTPNPGTTFDPGAQLTGKEAVQRDYHQEEIVVSLPQHPAYRLFAGQWEIHHYGSRAWSLSNKVFRQDVFNFTQEYHGGLDADIADKGQTYYEFAVRKFHNAAGSPATEQGVWPDRNLMTNKVALRYNLSDRLSLAAGALARQRHSQFNGTTQSSYSGHLSAAYRPTKDLSLSARLYGRSLGATHNNVFANGGQATVRPMDILFLNGDFSLRYSGIRHAVLSASYKPKLTNRKNSGLWTSMYAPATYRDGTSPPQSNGPAHQDIRHDLQGSIAIQFPQDVELEVGYRHLQANAAAYENTPTLSQSPSATLTVPLPRRLTWTAGFEETTSRNQKGSFTDFRRKVDTFLTGLTWSEAKGRGSAGVSYAFEEGTDKIFAYYYDRTNANAMRAPDAPYEYKNHVLSADAMLRPHRRVRVAANVSYTDSQNSALGSQILSDVFNVQTMNPSDLRILRYGLNARYELAKNFDARGGFRQESWVDRVDSLNDGRNTVYDLGVSAKF